MCHQISECFTNLIGGRRNHVDEVGVIVMGVCCFVLGALADRSLSLSLSLSLSNSLELVSSWLVRDLSRLEWRPLVSLEVEE